MTKKIHVGLLGIHRYARTIKALKWLKGNVLDVGCSDGCLLSVYDNIEGIEPDKQMFKEAIKWGKVKNIGGENLPYKNNSFDTVVCLDVIEHVENKQKVLSEIERVCKDRIIISFPIKPFEGHPEFMSYTPIFKKFFITHRSYNFAPMRIPLFGVGTSKDKSFNNEEHMKLIKNKWWLKVIIFFRPIINKILFLHGSITKTAWFLVYERIGDKI